MLLPPALVACTLNVYFTPLVNPVTTALVFGAATVEVIPVTTLFAIAVAV